MLIERHFGDLEAFDEAQNHYDLFRQTFVAPGSMSTISLANDKKFIRIASGPIN
jgi:hypothetical protein